MREKSELEKFDEMMAPYRKAREVYPVTIIATRYGGTYEGGPWAAFHMDETDVPEAATDSDIECAEFWASPEARQVGVGITPDAALADLRKRLGYDS